MDPGGTAAGRKRLSAATPQGGRLGATLLLIGDRATLMILRNAFGFGTRRFSDWRDELALSESVLAERLAGLVEAKVLARVEYSTHPPRFEYRLTERGLDLWSLLVSLVEWERAWSEHGALQPALRHDLCGRDCSPVLVCADDGEAVTPRHTRVSLDDPALAAGAVPPRVRRRSVQLDGARPELSMDLTIGVIGDRWSAVLLGLALTGVRRFAAFERAMHVSPTVLTDRLKRLTALGVLESVVPEGSRRADYRLTDRGRGLFAFYAFVVAWSDRWMGDDGPRHLRIEHHDHDLAPSYRCDVCSAPLERQAVRYVVGPGGAQSLRT